MTVPATGSTKGQRFLVPWGRVGPTVTSQLSFPRSEGFLGTQDFLY